MSWGPCSITGLHPARAPESLRMHPGPLVMQRDSPPTDPPCSLMLVIKDSLIVLCFPLHGDYSPAAPGAPWVRCPQPHGSGCQGGVSRGHTKHQQTPLEVLLCPGSPRWHRAHLMGQRFWGARDTPRMFPREARMRVGDPCKHTCARTHTRQRGATSARVQRLRAHADAALPAQLLLPAHTHTHTHTCVDTCAHPHAFRQTDTHMPLQADTRLHMCTHTQR